MLLLIRTGNFKPRFLLEFRRFSWIFNIRSDDIWVSFPFSSRVTSTSRKLSIGRTFRFSRSLETTLFSHSPGFNVTEDKPLRTRASPEDSEMKIPSGRRVTPSRPSSILTSKELGVFRVSCCWPPASPVTSDPLKSLHSPVSYTHLTLPTIYSV